MSLWRSYGSYLLITIYFLGWSLKDVIIKNNLAFVDPATLSMVISLSALIGAACAVGAAPFLAKLGQRGAAPASNARSFKQNLQWISQPRVLAKLVGLNIFMASALYLSTFSIDLIGPFNGAVIDMVVYPLCLSLLARVFLQERVSRALGWGLLIASSGFAIFYYHTFHATPLLLLPILVVALASLSFAAVLLLIKSLLNDGLSPAAIVFFRFLLLGLSSLYFLPRYSQPLPAHVWQALILIGLWCYTLLSLLFYYGLKGVSASVISIFVVASPLFTALFSWLLIPGTAYTPLQFVGLGLIMVGLLYTVAKEQQAQGAPLPPLA